MSHPSQDGSCSGLTSATAARAPPPSTFSTQHSYRSTRQPFEDSSSPQAPRDVTPPSSPLSPTPVRRLPGSGVASTFARTVSVSADPFSANAKAEPTSHPSFSKEFPHVKHPHPESPRRKGKKRSAPLSPASPAGAPVVARSSSPTPGSASAAHASSSSSTMSETGGQRLVAGNSVVRSASQRRQPRPFPPMASSTDSSDTDVRGALFADSSDDADPRSDDHLPWKHELRMRKAPGRHAEGVNACTAAAVRANAGLGLGPAFEEPASPTKGKSRSFARTSSNADPFSAWQGPAAAAASAAVAAAATDDRWEARLPSLPNPLGSPSARPPASQRRRLVGSSPKKLTRQGSSDSEDDDAHFPTPQWERRVPPPRPRIDWQQLVDGVFEKGEQYPRMDISGHQLRYIPPVVADLGKYVALEPPRKEPEMIRADSLSSMSASSSSLGLGRGLSRANTSTSLHLGGTSDGPGSGGAVNSPRSSGSRPFRRTDSAYHPTPGTLQLSFRDNLLTKLPSALFQLRNLRVLVLSHNRLKAIPPGIGELVNLRELHVSHNELRYMPAEIQRLHLDRFIFFPNNWRRPEADAEVTMRPWHSRTVKALRAAEGGSRGSAEPRVPMGPPALPIGRMGQSPTVGPSTASLANERSEMDVDDEEGSDGSPAPGPSPAAATSAPRGDARSNLAARLLSSRISSFAHRSESDSPAPEDRSTATDSKAEANVVASILGPLEIRHSEHDGRPQPLPSLKELVIRKLLSPFEGDEEGEGEDEMLHGASLALGGAAASSSSPLQRRSNASWARTTSSSSVLSSTGRRTETLLEQYENGTLRALKSDLNKVDFVLLEAARRSATESWTGSTSAVVGSSLGPSAGRQRRRRRGESRGLGLVSWAQGSEEGGDSEMQAAGAEDLSSSEGDDGASSAFASASSDEDGMLGSAALDRKARGAASATTATSTTRPRTSSKRKWEAMDAELELDRRGDNAARNPWLNRCPSPAHVAWSEVLPPAQGGVASTQEMGGGGGGGTGEQMTLGIDWPLSLRGCEAVRNGQQHQQQANVTMSAPPFSKATTARMEWVSHIASYQVANRRLVPVAASTSSSQEGQQQQQEKKEEWSDLIPILWRGCCRDCLAFLERG